MEFDIHYHSLSKGLIFQSDSLHINTGQSNAIDSFVGESKELSASESNNEKECKEEVVVSEQEIVLPSDDKPKTGYVIFVNYGSLILRETHT